MGESIENILRKDPHVLLIESGGAWGHKEIDPSLFKDRKKLAKDYIEDLWRFLERPYIVDDFHYRHFDKEFIRQVRDDLFVDKIRIYDLSALLSEQAEDSKEN